MLEVVLQRGSSGHDVRQLQQMLNACGYRLGDDGEFGPGTELVVERFQRQHGLAVDGVAGPQTLAHLLSHTPEEHVARATPLTITHPRTLQEWPHDDTASLLAFYGKPWADPSLKVEVPLPFRMTYDGKPTDHVVIHAKVAPALAAALAAIWDAYGRSQAALDATRFTKYSGSYNYRPIRGSARLSCHAFAAAIDVDAEDLPLGRPNPPPPKGMPAKIVDIMKAHGSFWGGDYRGRKDPMHFQWAHEG